MNSNEVAKEVSHWARMYQFSGEVKHEKSPESHKIHFEARTTSTRASTMVTRLRLIVHDINDSPDILVGKELISARPENRAALASWRIYVSVPIRRTPRK